MKPTKSKMLQAWLELRGARRINARTRKYQVWFREDQGKFYFVGRSGALLVSPRESLTEAHSLTGTPIYDHYCRIGERVILGLDPEGASPIPKE